MATRVGLVDAPSEIKSHEGRIPLVGAAMSLAFGVASGLLDRQPSGFADLFVSLLLIVSLGVIADKANLPARTKLVVQCICVSVVVLPSDLVTRIAGAVFGEHPFQQFQWPIPAVVGMVSATNIIDGLDGLTGGISLVALIGSPSRVACLV